MEIENSKMIYRGSQELARVYRGDTIVWEPYNDPRASEYLTSVILSGGTITSPYQEGLYYRKNGGEWTEGWHMEGVFQYGLDLPVSSGDTVEFKRECTGYTTINHNTVVFNVRGNIMSIAYGDNFARKRNLVERGHGQDFYRQFWYMNVVDASDLVLPARYLSSNCYESMFQGCEMLTSAPELTAPANSGGTGVGQSAYANMFNGCTSLTTAPVVPASVAKLANCCDGMFSGSSVTYVKCMAPEMFPNYYGAVHYPFHDWLAGVPSNGTFVKHPDMDIVFGGNNAFPRGADGIPSNWTVVDG